MAERILIRPDTTAPGIYRWLHAETGVTGSGGTDAVAQAIEGAEAILLLPAAMVLLCDVELPVKSPSQIRQALPFALEDKLAGDIEDYHWAWLRREGGRLAVAVVAARALAECIDPWRHAGINLVAAGSEALCLPYREGECTLFIDNGLAVFRYGPWRGGAIELVALPLLLDWLRGEGEDWTALRVFGDAGIGDWAAERGLAIHQETAVEPLAYMVEQVDAVSSLNLLTGPYQLRRASEMPIKRWLPAAVLLVAALVVQWGGQIRLNWELQDELQTLDQQTQALFQRTFPEVKRIVNVKVQAEQALRELQQQRRNADGEFLRLLHAAGERLQEQPGLQLQALTFADRTLQLRLRAENAEALAAVVQGLSSHWMANMQILQQTSTGTEAQIDVGTR